MKLLARTTRPADLDQCAELVRDRFLYDHAALEALRRMWLDIITRDTGRSAVLFDAEKPNRVLGFGISAAVTEARYDAIRSHRAPFIGKSLLEDWRTGNDPFLDEPAFAAANASTGIHVVTTHNGVADAMDATLFPVALLQLSENFIAQHSGCNIRGIVHESFGVPRDFAIAHGMTVIDYAPEFANRLADVPDDRVPIVINMTRDEAEHRPGNLMMYQLFLRYTAPRCGLRAAERQLLRLALEGTPDDAIAAVLNIAPRTLKKRWTDIYMAMEPVTGVSPGLGNGQRGAEIRRHVLRYVREHPEELHAYLREVRAK